MTRTSNLYVSDFGTVELDPARSEEEAIVLEGVRSSSLPRWVLKRRWLIKLFDPSLHRELLRYEAAERVIKAQLLAQFQETGMSQREYRPKGP